MANTNQPEPIPLVSSTPFIWDLVVQDMLARDKFGMDKYNMRLQANNGRDPLIDAYQEALDLAVYLRQAIFEKKGE